MIKFGLARVCITPEIGTKLFGQVVQIETDGKYNDLYARSFYLNSKKTDFLIISCDLLIFTKETADGIRAEISKKTGIGLNNIVIHTTHTHAGPVVTDIFNEKTSNTLIKEKIINLIIDSGIKALRTRKPVKSL